MIYALFAIQLIFQSVYCSITYSSFKNNSNFIYMAMAFGLVSQLLWAIIVKLSPSATSTTVYGVFYDSITFLAWCTIPLIFAWSKFNWMGVLGVGFIVMGMILVGLQDILVKYVQESQVFNYVKTSYLYWN